MFKTKITKWKVVINPESVRDNGVFKTYDYESILLSSIEIDGTNWEDVVEEMMKECAEQIVVHEYGRCGTDDEGNYECIERMYVQKCTYENVQDEMYYEIHITN